MEIYGADINGIDGYLVHFRTVVNQSGQGVKALGLAGKVVKEGIARAAKAIETLEGDWSDVLSNKGYTIQLGPAETPKSSSGLDLPIAVMLLYACIHQRPKAIQDALAALKQQLQKAGTGRLKPERRKRILEEVKRLVRHKELVSKYRKHFRDTDKKYLLIGELDITSGRLLTPEHGMFGMIAAAKPGFTVIVPEDSEVHASIVGKRHKEITALKAADLQEVWNVILGARPRRTSIAGAKVKPKRFHHHIPDFNEIEGCSRGKRAMTVALAGGHNILLVGPTGQGKTMLAESATKLLPRLTPAEMFECNKVYSARGELREREVVYDRPFCKAHVKITEAALFGGGSPYPRPGLVSAAHNGVLIFDEINLHPGVLVEKLRSALSDRCHRVQRATGTLEYPSRFVLVATMNPCKCGDYGHYRCPTCNETYFARNTKCTKHPDVQLISKCTCRSREVESYGAKLSAPLLNRIDLKVMVSSHDHVDETGYRYASSTVKRQIRDALAVQESRYANVPNCDRNADVANRARFEKLTPKVPSHVEGYVDRLFKLIESKRTQVKVLLVARTIADLEGVVQIRLKDVKEAVDLMGLVDGYFSKLQGEGG